jgi:hypothetical protein
LLFLGYRGSLAPPPADPGAPATAAAAADPEAEAAAAAADEDEGGLEDFEDFFFSPPEVEAAPKRCRQSPWTGCGRLHAMVAGARVRVER